MPSQRRSRPTHVPSSQLKEVRQELRLTDDVTDGSELHRLSPYTIRLFVPVRDIASLKNISMVKLRWLLECWSYKRSKISPPNWKKMWIMIIFVIKKCFFISFQNNFSPGIALAERVTCLVGWSDLLRFSIFDNGDIAADQFNSKKSANFAARAPKNHRDLKKKFDLFNLHKPFFYTYEHSRKRKLEIRQIWT